MNKKNLIFILLIFITIVCIVSGCKMLNKKEIDNSFSNNNDEEFVQETEIEKGVKAEDNINLEDGHETRNSYDQVP